MNEDCNSIEPGTDLDQYIQGRLATKSGVGANAGSMVDMKHVATDSLSELVWSPHKGLSLRCADSSFNHRKSSLLWNAGTNNPSLALPQSRAADKSDSNKSVEDRIHFSSQAEIHLKTIPESKDTFNRTSFFAAGHMTSEVKMHTLEKGMGGYAEETGNRVESDILFLDLKESGPPNIPDAGHILVDEGPAAMNNKCSSFPVYANRIREVSKRQDKSKPDKEPHSLLFVDPIGVDKQEENASLTAGKDVLDLLERCTPSASHPTIFVKLESSAENDLQNMNHESAVDEGSKIIVLNPACEIRGGDSEHEKKSSKDRGDVASPSNSKPLWKQRKGKEKAVSVGDVHGGMSNDEDNSYGSVESCNSAFFSTSKRRWSLEEQLIVGSKRAKKEGDNVPGPTINSGQDSSFMHWISNLMKGFSQSIPDVAPSLDLTLAEPIIKHGSSNEELITYKRSHDPKLNSTGFQSIFRSLYSPIPRRGEVVLEPNFQSKQGSEEIEVIPKGYDVNATPIACFRESGNFGNQVLLTNEKSIEFTPGEEASPLVQPKKSSEVSFGSHQSHLARSNENKNSCDVVIRSKKDEVMYDSDLGKCKSNINVDCDVPSVKTNYNIGNTSDPLKSLWITRFATKSPSLVLNPETCNQDTKDDSHSSMHSGRLFPCPQNNLDFHQSIENLDTPICKEPSYGTNVDTSTSHKEFKGHNEKSICKFNPTLRSLKLRNSEAMASNFARRLGAFKHIIPSDVSENAGHETVTCFFCGTKGHHLQDCSEITGKEVEDLSRNITLCNKANELHPICLRCFQLNHWANACPIAFSRGRLQSESCASLANCEDTGETPLNLGIGLNAKPQPLENRKLEEHASMLDDIHNVNIATDLRHHYKVAEEVSTGMSIPNCVKESDTVQVDSFAADQLNSGIPRDIFNAVRTLWLSRNDVLKCMNSHISLSNLDGFFLRIRLGKWEEGIGVTGYHVACIMGEQPAKSSVSVIVQGMECQVQSQFISNHDFLENELMAWWSAGTATPAASKQSSKGLPLAADLRAKVKKKRHLGL